MLYLKCMVVTKQLPKCVGYANVTIEEDFILVVLTDLAILHAWR